MIYHLFWEGQTGRFQSRLGAFGDTIAALTVGTSGALRFITTQPQFHPEMETFCYVLDQKHWVVGGATSNGAGIFDWAGHTFLQEVVQSAKEKGENPYDALLSAIALCQRVPMV